MQNSGPWDPWLPVVKNSRLFAQRRHRARCAPLDRAVLAQEWGAGGQRWARVTEGEIWGKGISTAPTEHTACLGGRPRGRGGGGGGQVAQVTGDVGAKPGGPTGALNRFKHCVLVLVLWHLGPRARPLPPFGGLARTHGTRGNTPRATLQYAVATAMVQGPRRAPACRLPGRIKTRSVWSCCGGVGLG